MVKSNLGTEETETGVYRCQSDWRVEQNTQTVQRTAEWVLSPVMPQNRTILSSFLFDRFFVTSPVLIDDTVLVDNYIQNTSPPEPKIV